MPGSSSSATRMLARLLGIKPRNAASDTACVLDGNTAVAVTEACIGEALGLGGSFPVGGAEAAWQTELRRERVNLHGDVLCAQTMDGARGALAAAMGGAMAGRRAAAFLSGPDLATVQDLMVMAAGRHLPLVVHLANRAMASHAAALGSGHEAYHLCADSGFFLLFAANAQEAVDLTLVAHRVAERALVPGLVAMDGERTALASQDVRLPQAKLVRELLGSAGEQITTPTPAQKVLFGERRRRVPRWHNLDHPVLHGALEGPESWALGATAQAAYFGGPVAGILDDTCALLSEHTGRQQGLISTHRLDDADVVLLVQGAATETAEAAADHLRGTVKLKVGVLGVRCLRPFPGAEITRCLAGKRAVAVLERTHAPLAGDPPLLGEVRAAVDRALENACFGADVHSGYPAMRERPRLCSVLYGLAGAPLRGNDLMALAQEMAAPKRSRIYLGLELARKHSRYPKRQVLLDALRHEYPHIGEMGLTSTAKPPDLRAPGAVSLAVHRICGQGGEQLAIQAADLLKRLLGGQVRSLPGLDWEHWGGCVVDRLTHAAQALRDPGDEHPLDLAVLAGRGWHPRLEPATGLRDGGALLLPGLLLQGAARTSFPGELRTAIRERRISVYRLAAVDGGIDEDSGALWQERLLGGLFGMMVATGIGNLGVRRVLTRREEMLRDLAESETAERLEAFKAGMERVSVLELDDLGLSAGDEDRAPEQDAPGSLQGLRDSGEGYASLARFWSQVGAPYRDGESEELTSDPFLATGTVPALSAAFRDHSDVRTIVPVFDPALCTGCGKCWAVCPDSAIGASVLSADALVEAGIAVAGADELRSVRRLAAQIHSLVTQADSRGASAGDLIGAAWERLRETTAMPDERRRALQESIERVREKIGPLPLARTDALFGDAEANNQGGDELLSVVIDPAACKGCGLCVATCDTNALACVAQDAARLDRARKLWALWQRMPESAAPSLERATRSSSIDPMGAALLARRALLALPGGDGAEPASGERLTVRRVLAIAESVRQPPLERLAAQVAEVHARIPDVVRTLLTEDLPTDDLDALAQHLGSGQRAESSPADTERLHRLVEMGRTLGVLRRRLRKDGPNAGRAGFSLAVAPDTATAWAGAFPHNPFRIPVALDASGDTVPLAMGLLDAQLQDAANELDLLHTARCELETPRSRNRVAAAGTAPGWRGLDCEHRRFLPPLLLIGGDRSFTGKALGPLQALLRSDLPVKVISLCDLDLGVDTLAPGETSLAEGTDPGVDIALLALAGRQAFVAQTALAHTRHFLDSVRAALQCPGPALIHVHAPSPARHGFAPEQTCARAAQAVPARAFPLFRYDPAGSGVFGSRLSLEGNPQPRETWSRDESGRALTVADWALGERRFAAHFVPLDEGDGAPTPLSEYLELDAGARSRTTPFVTGEDGDTTGFGVSDAMVAATKECMQSWRTLQELAGLVTPFTGRIECELREALDKEHEATLATLQSDSDSRIAHLREQTQAQIAEKITERLMSLAGYRAP